MRKFILVLFSVLLFTACDKDINVEEVTKSDKAQMENKEQCKWYETQILMDDYLDQDAQKPVEVVNVFQALVDDDPVVYKFQHYRDGTTVKDSVKGFWIEDCALEECAMPFDSAFNLVKEVNLPKPHSKHVCLRNPLGPLDTNPQWVFGNIESQIWVDTKTGEIRTSNPAFPEEDHE